VIDQIKAIRGEVGCSYTEVCDIAGVPRSSLMRWKGLVDDGKPAVKRPGVKKKNAIDRDELGGRIDELKHCNKMTLGSGELFKEYRHGISRREFQWVVAQKRAEAKRERRESMVRVECTVPGSVWGMDDTKGRGLPIATKMCLNQLRDACSRKALSAKVTEMLLPEGSVAEILEQQFCMNGPPLILKLDNGSNLNGGAVLDVCNAYGVIILNSPPHYPQYNGQIEWAQRELKWHMAWLLQDLFQPDIPIIQTAADFTVERLNRWPRPCLLKDTSDRVFESRHEAMSGYTLDRRKEVREEITVTAMHIMANNDWKERQTEQAAWRIAVETWLRRNGLITVSAKGKCYPIKNTF
jgi:transposase InsO family protein